MQFPIPKYSANTNAGSSQKNILSLFFLGHNSKYFCLSCRFFDYIRRLFLNDNMETLYEKVINGVADGGYVICDDFLPSKVVEGLRNNLLAFNEEGELKRAGIGKWNHHQKDLEIRSDKIFWLSHDTTDPAETELLNIINNFKDYLNRTCFTGIKSLEFHYALYPKGSFYKRHLDQFSNDPGRKFTMIFYLNSDWKPEDGGQLVIFLANGEELVVQPLAGRLVVFESAKIEHEVRPANRERMSVTGWLKNVEVKIPL